MSQARLTDFFSHRKRSSAAPAKATKPRGRASSARTRSAKSSEAPLCPSAVHEEFIRVIDEAAGPQHGESAGSRAPASPRTPKRSSAAEELGLGAAALSATAGHSSAKKRRQDAASGDAAAPDTRRRRTARKKLALPPTPEQTGDRPPEPGKTASSGPAAPVRQQVTGAGATGQVLSKEEYKVLMSRIQRIKRHAEEPTGASSSPAAPPPATDGPTAPEPTTDVKTLQLSVSRAKQLAEKVLRRKEEREAEESEQTETEAEDSAERPAYQRYHTLAQATPPGLSLPYQYKLLAEMFRSMDTVVAMLYNRHETPTFAKVKQGVQDMMRKRFEQSHAAQIKTVFPEAYTFRQEKNIPTFSSSMKRSSYQLTVEPRILPERSEAPPVLSASRLLERRRLFHRNLVDVVKQHHKDFLSSLVPPLSVPDDKLTRWHPRFNVDSVPAVRCSALPQPPPTERLATAQEVLDKARSFIAPKMEKALESLTLKMEAKAAGGSEPGPPQNPEEPQEPAPPGAPVPAALKGVSQSLLDRIRAKEAQKVTAAMTRDPAQEERLLMMSRLGELARILRMVFVAEKKAAVIMDVACSRMVASYRSALSTGEMEKHLRLLAEVAADWLTIHPIRKDFYLKLNKNMELNIVLEKLSQRLKEEERL